MKRGFYVKKEIKKRKNIYSTQYNFLEFFNTILWNKISLLLMDSGEEVKEEDSTNIFSMIEQEFGRTLSPIEYEIVKAWLETNKSVELISLALKESVMNGARNLRYMDTILYNWDKEGVKTKADVENRKAKRRKQEDSKKVDVFDYDWLEEND